MQPMTSELKPSPVFVAISLLVIAVCVFVVSLIPASFAWDPFTGFMSVVMFLPMSTAIGVTQYRATFQRKPRAAGIAATLLSITGGLLLAGVAVACGEAAAALEDPSWIWGLSPIFLVGASCIVAAVLDWRWAGRIRSQPPAVVPAAERQRRLSTQDKCVAVTVVAAVAALAAYFFSSVPPEFAEHVEPSKTHLDLPPGASDVSYRRGFRGTMTAEFTTDEGSFREWLENDSRFSRSRPPEVRTGEIVEPFTIYRYYRPNADPGDPGTITITQGLYYDWSKEDRGVHAAFDRTTSRAYFDVHYH